MTSGFSSPDNKRKKTLLRSRSCAQRNLDLKRLEPASQDFVMLVGKNLRRRHERSLKARFNGEQNRSDGNDCFSRTDITLQEAIHWLR